MNELRHILLAEDDANDIELTLEALSDARLANAVDVVRDGAQALDYLFHQGQCAGRAGGDPAVVLLDIKMSKVDGLEVLRRIRQDPNLHYLPVVILTSFRWGEGWGAGLDRPGHYQSGTSHPFGLLEPTRFLC